MKEKLNLSKGKRLLRRLGIGEENKKSGRQTGGGHSKNKGERDGWWEGKQFGFFRMRFKKEV